MSRSPRMFWPLLDSIVSRRLTTIEFPAPDSLSISPGHRHARSFSNLQTVEPLQRYDLLFVPHEKIAFSNRRREAYGFSKHVRVMKENRTGAGFGVSRCRSRTELDFILCLKIWSLLISAQSKDFRTGPTRNLTCRGVGNNNLFHLLVTVACVSSVRHLSRTLRGGSSPITVSCRLCIKRVRTIDEPDPRSEVWGNPVCVADPNSGTRHPLLYSFQCRSLERKEAHRPS